MSKPVVAIVGRPNVGKSTLFNVLAGSTISIVKDTPGVTRDRIYADCTWLNNNFTLIDTGGIEPDSKDIILAQMREQAQIAQFRKLENKRLPQNTDYSKIRGLRLEAAQKLNKQQPSSIGQASRISGVNPADVSVLLIHFGMV